MPTPADLFLSPDLTEIQAREYLQSLGFRDPVAADGHLQKMAEDLVVRQALGRLAPDLIPSLLESPDPDAALAGLSYYVAARTGRAMFLDYLREDPRALHVLIYVLGASPPLSEVLVRTPEYFHWLVPQIERSAPDRQDHEEELASVFSSVDDPADALNILRRWKRREVLRIGTRELLRRETVQTVAMQLSDVACVAVDFALAIVMRQLLEAEGRQNMPGRFAVIATGHLGAQEISYASPLDLLYVYETAGAEHGNASDAQTFFTLAGAHLTAALRDETRDGQLYDVALPAYPQSDGRLTAGSLEEYAEHFSGSADNREREQLTRTCAAAGDTDLGSRFIARIQPIVYGASALAGRRDMPVAPIEPDHPPYADIDRLTQGFQLSHGTAHAALRGAGTLAALDAMCKLGLIEETARRELDHAYIFLRSAEHRRQLGVPENQEQQLVASRERVREICRSIVHGP